MTNAITEETIVRDFYQQFKARNKEAVTNLLHADFRFTSPEDQGIDQAGYFARCWPMGDDQIDFTIEQLAVTGPFVFLHYNFTKKTGEQVHNVELLTIEEDKISEIRVFSGQGSAKQSGIAAA